MPECHDCTKKRGPDCWLKCKGPADGPNNHGKNHVSVDLVASFIPAPVPADPPTDYDAARHFIRALTGLGMIEREIIFSRLMGQQYPDITARLNTLLAKKITIQGVHARSKKALKDPAFEELFREMVVKQQKRKKKGQTHE